MHIHICTRCRLLLHNIAPTNLYIQRRRSESQSTKLCSCMGMTARRCSIYNLVVSIVSNELS